jgi:hypothetical protein
VGKVYVDSLHIGRIRMDIDNPGVTWDSGQNPQGIHGGVVKLSGALQSECTGHAAISLQQARLPHAS